MKAAAVGHGISARQAFGGGGVPGVSCARGISALAEIAQDAGPHAVKGQKRD